MPLEEQLGKFECQRCNECCRQAGYVYLANGEAEKIAAFLERDIYSFTNDFCEILDRKQLALKKHQDESCIFLTAGGCSIHEAKPTQCRDFPVKWRTVKSFDYCAGLKALFGSK